MSEIIHLTPKGEHYANDHQRRDGPIPLSRPAIEEEVERLIELLDVVDGDPDIEHCPLD